MRAGPLAARTLFAATALLAAASCETVLPAAGTFRSPLSAGVRAVPAAVPRQRSAEVAGRQAQLLEGARWALGRRELVVRGRRFNMDCTGAVLAIYYYAGLDLSRNFPRYRGGGVERLYRSLEVAALIYDTLEPVPGDIIFWDNTYDRNNDGRWNDPLTHVGMVVSVSREGDIEYVHLNYRRGIVIERMNLRRPQVYRDRNLGGARVVNSPIRMRVPGRPHPPRWLASHLYRAFGMGYLF